MGTVVVEYNCFKEKIIHYFDKYNILHSESIINDFYKFTVYLLSENEKYNLTSITEIDEIIVKHYIDSIIIQKYFEIPQNAKVIDIGTGAGFPALPIYIMRKDLHVTFLESIGKKINFVKNAAEKIESPQDFVFLNGRAEEYAKEPGLREIYDIAVFRAVAKLSVMCELSTPFVKPKGYLIAYKSKNANSEIHEAQNALTTLGLKITKTIEFELENNARACVIIQKQNPTPMKYPRKYPEIIKNPL